MSRKICFVAMGFGKKMDYRNSKEVDLDIIYKKVTKNEILNSTTPFGGGIYSRTVKVYSFI